MFLAVVGIISSAKLENTYDLKVGHLGIYIEQY